MEYARVPLQLNQNDNNFSVGVVVFVLVLRCFSLGGVRRDQNNSIAVRKSGGG